MDDTTDDNTTDAAGATAPAQTSAPPTAPAQTSAPPTAVVESTAPQSAPPTPIDWAGLRSTYAKGDAKLEARLSRYSSAEAALDALIAAQNKISSGSLKAPLPEKHTPDELKAWRADNGIPDSPDGYELDIPDASELDAGSLEAIENFVTTAHEANMTPAQVNAVVSAMVEQRTAAIEARAAADEESRLAARESMRQEWGVSEFNINLNLINGLLDTAPGDTKNQLLSARLPSGELLGNDPQALRWLANLAREINPIAALAPSSGANAPQVVEAEKAALEALMGDHDSKYWKGPEAKILQDRYMAIINGRSAAARRNG